MCCCTGRACFFFWKFFFMCGRNICVFLAIATAAIFSGYIGEFLYYYWYEGMTKFDAFWELGLPDNITITCGILIPLTAVIILGCISGCYGCIIYSIGFYIPEKQIEEGRGGIKRRKNNNKAHESDEEQLIPLDSSTSDRSLL